MSRPKSRNYIPRIIAPRLASGLSRETIGHGLPPEVKEGLKVIAQLENKSVSWVLEQIIIRYFGFDSPEYVRRKKTDEKEHTKAGARVIPYRAGSRILAEHERSKHRRSQAS